MDFTIRPATTADYPTIVAIGWSATPDFGLSVADLAFADSVCTPATIARRVVAVTDDDHIVGAAYYSQSAPKDDPQRFCIWLHVLPQFQGCGIGKGLYALMLAELAAHKPRCLETGVRTDLPRAMRFLAERGFVEARRECETQLDLTSFTPTAFAEDLQRVARRGITLQTLSELAADPARNAKLYELHRRQHEAEGPQTTFAAFAEWQASFWRLPHLLPDGFCVAVDGENYIGHSHARRSETAILSYGYTGILPAYRNQGIARAMKLRVLEWAKAQGYTAVRSWSDSRNEAMIRVNLHLGFVVQPPVLWVEQKWKPPRF
ncbi:MAG: GNAT family N-acetyltransferase [Caldilineaceae bacterium]